METVVTKQSVSEEAAHHLIAAAVDKAHELGVPQVVAVVDESGMLKAFRRMDGAPLASIEAAQNKAYTALFGLPSHVLFEATKADEALRTALPSVTRMMLVGGGMPIRVNGAIVGAIGVGGGTTDQDIACAEAALDSLR